MKISRIGDCSTYKVRKYIILSIYIFVLSTLILPFFNIESAIAQTSQDQVTADKKNQKKILNIEYGATDRPDFKKQPEKHRVVRVGLYENKPKIYTDKTGAAAGIFPSILAEIARKEKWRLIYAHYQWSAGLKALQDGDIDLMPDVAYSPERDKLYDFNKEVVVNSWSVVYAKSRKKINVIHDLNGHRVAVLKGSIQEGVLKEMTHGFGLHVTFIEANSFKQAFSFVSDGRADAAVANHFFGDYFSRQYGLERTSIIFNPVSLYFATAAGANHDLLDAIDNNLRIMKSEPNSVYYKTLSRWVVRPTKEIIPQYLIWIISGISGLLFLCVLFIFLLRWQVRVATENLAQSNMMLRDSEEKFRNLFHKHTAVKLLIDPDNGNIVEANEAAERFYGWSGEQLCKMNIQDINLLSPEQIEEEMEKAKDLERTHFEFRHRLADGSVRDVAVFSSHINIRGKTLLHSIIHDISAGKQMEKEREKLQAQLTQAQKMESVGRLAGGVAHDYNNILSVIIGYSELALGRVQSEDPLYDDLKTIHSAAQRSRDITRQLLAFARKQTIKPKVLNLNDIIESMLKILRRLVGEDIVLEWIPDKDIWPILMDPSQIDQMLANLCINARDAIVDVGRITIETGLVSFDQAYCDDHTGFAPGDFVMLAVSDDGCGMDRETQDNIFEPFFTTKDTGKGTGLGLATVYGIVKQNGGFINVYSEPGNGTIFKIYLPRSAKDIVEEYPRTVERASEGNGETILVVEDESSILTLIEKTLTNLNYRVLTANSPSDAIRKVEAYNSRIDLLITDVIMPEMNGHELADKIQEIYPDLKSLYMSGYTTDIITHRGMLDKDVSLIVKPFSNNELAVKVREVLDSEGTFTS